MNGCHNRRLLGQRPAQVQDGWVYAAEGASWAGGVLVLRTARMTTVPHATSTDCQYTHSAAGRLDPGCAGCHWRASATTQELISA
jgi:hypothetical protein